MFQIDKVLAFQGVEHTTTCFYFLGLHFKYDYSTDMLLLVHGNKEFAVYYNHVFMNNELISVEDKMIINKLVELYIK